jgi:predicted acylesterase/phospholipase RssA
MQALNGVLKWSRTRNSCVPGRPQQPQQLHAHVTAAKRMPDPAFVMAMLGKREEDIQRGLRFVEPAPKREKKPLPKPKLPECSGDIENIVISGGAFKCFAIIGAMQVLEDQDRLSRIRNLIGTSAGAILCYLTALGYKPRDIIDEAKEERFQSALRFSPSEVLQFLSTYGLDSGNRLVAVLQELMAQKYDREDMTFEEFAHVTGKNLVVCVSNLTESRTEYMSVLTTPKESVVGAIRASCGLPIIFTPVERNGCVYLDGGLFSNSPIEWIARNSDTSHAGPKDSVAFNVTSEQDQENVPYTDFASYVEFMTWSIVQRSQCNKPTPGRVHELTISVPRSSAGWLSLLSNRKALEDDMIDRLFRIGYKSCVRAMEEFDADDCEIMGL